MRAAAGSSLDETESAAAHPPPPPPPFPRAAAASVAGLVPWGRKERARNRRSYLGTYMGPYNFVMGRTASAPIPNAVPAAATAASSGAAAAFVAGITRSGGHQTLAGEGHEWFMQWEHYDGYRWIPFHDSANLFIEAAFLEGFADQDDTGPHAEYWCRWDFREMKQYKYRDVPSGPPLLVAARDIRRVLVFQMDAQAREARAGFTAASAGGVYHPSRPSSADRVSHPIAGPPRTYASI